MSNEQALRAAREALRDLLTRYTGLVNSGDAGNWNPELEEEVIAARATLPTQSVEGLPTDLEKLAELYHDWQSFLEHGDGDDFNDTAYQKEAAYKYMLHAMSAYATAAVLAEREACAEIVENADYPDCGGWSTGGIADAIRARKAKP